MKPLLYLSLLYLLTSTPVLAKKVDCQKYKTKLEKIQSKQRQANSVKRSNKLKEQELKTFKLWRKCKQGKLK